MNHQITIKYSQLRNLTAVLERIKRECRLPVIKALHLKRLIRSIAAEATLYNDQYNEIIETYAKKDDNGERIIDRSVPGVENILLNTPQEFAKEMQELFDHEFELDGRDADLTINDLGSMQITVEEIEALESILDEEEEVSDNKILPFPGQE